MRHGRKPPRTTPGLDLAAEGAEPRGRLARVLEKAAAPPATRGTMPPGPRVRLGILLAEDTADRLRSHCRVTGQEVSAWAERVIRAALDAQGIGDAGDRMRGVTRET